MSRAAPPSSRWHRWRLRTRPELLTHPVLLAALATLVVNDCWAKQTWPGLVTGKLSDVAGVVMLAIVCATAGMRPAVACASVAAAFAALKTVPGVAVVAAPLLGGVTRRDPTDLAALAALVPLGVWLRRHRPRCTASTSVRRVLRVAVVTAAILATTATSDYENGVVSVRAQGSTAYAITDVDGERSWYISRDGGRTWASTAAPAEPPPSTHEVCIEDQCWELRGMGGDAQTLATRTGSSPWRELPEVYDKCWYTCAEDLAVVDGPHGPVLLVPMVADGVLRWDGRTWTTAAVGKFSPHRQSDAPTAGMLVLAVACVAIVVTVIFITRRRGRRQSPMSPGAGWYRVDDGLRWWDGQQWTGSWWDGQHWPDNSWPPPTSGPDNPPSGTS